jgi:hypothetical protein
MPDIFKASKKGTIAEVVSSLESGVKVSAKYKK